MIEGCIGPYLITWAFWQLQWQVPSCVAFWCGFTQSSEWANTSDCCNADNFDR